MEFELVSFMKLYGFTDVEAENREDKHQSARGNLDGHRYRVAWSGISSMNGPWYFMVEREDNGLLRSGPDEYRIKIGLGNIYANDYL